MAAPRLLTCPICAQPGFPSVDALRSGLVCAATRPLACPVCADVLLGLDKFTIHLFGHTLQQQQQQQDPAAAAAAPNAALVDAAQRCDLCGLVVPDEALLLLHRRLAHAKALPAAPSQAASPAPADALMHKQLQYFCAQVKSQLQTEQTQQQRLAQQLQVHLEQLRQRALQHGSQQLLEEYATQQLSTPAEAHRTEPHQTKQRREQELLRHYDNQQLKREEQYQQLQQEVQRQQAEHGVQQVHMQQPLKRSFAELREKDNDALQSPQVQREKQNTQKVQELKKDEENKQHIHNQHHQVRQQQQLSQHNQESISILQRLKQDEESILAQQQQQQQQYTQQQKQQQQQQQQQQQLDYERQQVTNPDASKLAFPCHLCAKAFKMRGSLMVHLRVAHSGINAGKILRSWVESAQQLQQQEPDTKAFSCNICGKGFKKEQQLTQHQKTHEGKQWECDVCSKLFTTKYFLKKHKRLHTGEMPYSCPACNKTFTFQQSYHKHLLYHSDEKPHVCTECDRAFKELSTLHNHQRIHTGEKPFACETCGKCFRQRVSYLVHRRIHTGAMPYQCTACGKSFRYKVSQRTHKCPAQPPGTVVRQSGELVQRLLQGVQQRQEEEQRNEKCNSSTPLGLNIPQKGNNITTSGTIMQRTNSTQISKMAETTNEHITQNEECHIPQQNNQFIIFLEGDMSHGLSSGLLVAAPPIVMLPSETNLRVPENQWPSLETVSQLTNSLELSHSTDSENIGVNSFSDHKIVNLLEHNNHVMEKKDECTREHQKKPDATELQQKENERIKHDTWHNMNSETPHSLLEANKQANASNNPDLVVHTTDFFTMVMSPQQTTGLPSPSEGLRQLTLSPPEDIENQDQSGALFQLFMSTNTSQSSVSASEGQTTDDQSNAETLQSTSNIHPSKTLHLGTEDSVTLSTQGELHTINEESLKQLLYGSSL